MPKLGAPHMRFDMFKQNVHFLRDSEQEEGFDDSDAPNSLHAPGMHDPNKIKSLPPSVVKDIEQKNVARKLAGLSPIVIKVRRCIACGSKFESAGNRTCGCSSRTAGTIAGREII
jgi:hypothetical protein